MDYLEEDLPPKNKIQDENRRQLYAMTKSMDRACGRILDKLKGLGLSDNTLVIFTNDNGGAWINPKEGESSNYFTALHTTSTEQSVDVLVPSGSTIQWRYKDTLTVGALSTKSFQELTEEAESVQCKGSVTHEMNIGECADRKASSTLTLKNDGFVSVYVDIYFSTDGGNSWNNHASGVLIQPRKSIWMCDR